MFGCTTDTTAASRIWRSWARQTPHVIGAAMTTASATPHRHQLLRSLSIRTIVASSPLHSAIQKVTPRAPTSSAIPTSSGKCVSEVPSPSQGNAIVLGRCARNHSAAVHATGSAIQSGVRTPWIALCSIHPKSAATPIRPTRAARNARIASFVNQISATRIQ